MQIPDPNQPLPSQASYVGFAETQWSLVLTAGSGSPSATDALDRLCATYWPPVFSYLRRQNLSTEDARDLTQEFFAEFTAKNLPGTADQTRGRFRNYLLGALKKSLSHAREKASRQKRGGGAVVISLDAVTDEGKPVLELADAATPEAAYERRWALTVL
jgi:RNA polymerase sigma-70 factor (ECF subfamily)